MSCQDLVHLRFSTTRTESVKFIDVILEEGVCNYKVCSGTHVHNLCTFSIFYTITISILYTLETAWVFTYVTVYISIYN